MALMITDECINCDVCEPECPADAIVPDSDGRATGDWLALNAQYAKVWPNITHKARPPADADAWNGVDGKKADFSPEAHDETAAVTGEPSR